MLRSSLLAVAEPSAIATFSQKIAKPEASQWHAMRRIGAPLAAAQAAGDGIPSCSCVGRAAICRLVLEGLSRALCQDYPGV
jgi:hypothetical protein